MMPATRPSPSRSEACSRTKPSQPAHHSEPVCYAPSATSKRSPQLRRLVQHTPPPQPARPRHARGVRTALLRSQHRLTNRRHRQHEDRMKDGRFNGRVNGVQDRRRRGRARGSRGHRPVRCRGFGRRRAGPLQSTWPAADPRGTRACRRPALRDPPCATQRRRPAHRPTTSVFADGLRQLTPLQDSAT